MNTCSLSKVTAAIVTTLVALSLAGCGSSATSTATAPAGESTNSTVGLPNPASGGVDVLLIDNSNPELVNAKQADLGKVVKDSARRHRSLVIAAIDAGPLRTASWHTVPFGKYYAEARPKRTAQSKLDALASGLLSQIVRLGQSKQTSNGSGQIGGLQAAGELGNVGRIFMVTDGIPNATGAPDVHSASQQDIERASKRLGERISGLNGVPVVFIGVGYGVSSDATLASAKELMMLTTAAAGAKPIWRPSLAG